VLFGDVVDQFEHVHGLADTGAAEQADLAALGVRREQVDDLDARDQDLGFRRLFDIGWSFLVDGAQMGAVERTGFVNRLADHIHDTAQTFIANWHRNWSA